MAKYVAAGYFVDAEKLLNEFMHENSFDFSVFVQLWKKRSFAAVYLGRDKHQISCFTHEIFQITLGFLSNKSFLFQVGVFYLLYALYKHQIHTPFVKIRITFPQFEVFRKIQNAALKNGFHTLHYVTDYLYQHAFDFVAFSTLYGPRSSRTKIDYNDTTFGSSSLIKEMKSEMAKLRDSNVLEDLRDLSLQYLTVREKVYSQGAKNTYQDYEEHIKQLHNLVSDGPMNFPKRYSKAESSVGSRRLAIKSAAFSNKALFRQLNNSEEESETERSCSESVPKTKKRKRLPREKRRTGRPRKGSEPALKSPKMNKNSASDVESPRKDLWGKRTKKITFLDDYNIEPEIKPIKLLKKKSLYEDSDSDSEEEEAALKESESYDSEEIEQFEHQ